jgi:SAM-dependent methyltransferase
MGLESNAVRFLIAARKKGVQFNRTMTLGRQHFAVPPGVVCDLMGRQGLPTEGLEAAIKSSVFSEPFFQALGAKQVDSIDNAEFEGANFIHDLNQPIPADWKEKFDIVYDGGTLEHVFNFPTALRSAMEMLKTDGRIFIHTQVNNAAGHGFYQFSPELFFGAFSPENGFEVERLIVHRTGPYGRWYEVSDSNKIRERVELISFTPISALIQARRVKVVPIFEKWPQQAIYADLWEAKGQKPKPHWFRATFPRLARWLSPFRTAVKFYTRQSLSNRRYFKPVEK